MRAHFMWRALYVHILNVYVCRLNPFSHLKGLERTQTALRPFYNHMPEVKNCYIVGQLYIFMLTLVLKYEHYKKNFGLETNSNVKVLNSIHLDNKLFNDYTVFSSRFS